MTAIIAIRFVFPGMLAMLLRPQASLRFYSLRALDGATMMRKDLSHKISVLILI
jgi:hypothetical protein